MSALNFFTQFLGRRPIFPYNNHIRASWKETIKKDKKFEELIYWSSPSLHQELLRLKKGQITTSKEEKVINRLYRYLVRSYSRSTPFGITAGFYVGEINKKNTCPGNTVTAGESGEKERRLVTPDAEFISILIRSLLEKTSIASKIKYFMNPSLYKVGDNLRFYECYKQQNYRISSIEAFPIIEEIASHLEAGCDIISLSELLGDEFTCIEKNEFIESLISENILINEFEYNRLDPNLLDRIINYLSTIEEFNARNIRESLIKYKLLQAHLELSELGDYPYLEINSLKREFEILLDVKNINNLFHIDLLLPSEPICFSQNELNNILEATDYVSRISSSKNPIASQLENFRRTFFDRYNNEVVALMEVLDPDCGLGFPANPNFGVQNENELLDNAFNSNASKSSSLPTFISNNLTDSINKSINDKSFEEIDLKDIDLSGVHSKLTGLADTFSIMCSKLPDGNIMLSNIGGSSSLNLLGRFSVSNPKVESLCEELLENEQKFYQDVIIAEIIFIPSGKAANVVKRKVLTEYFIPVNAGLDLPNKQRLDLSDLYVTIHHRQVVLISKKFNKRVIPRLSSAHNFHHTTSAVYKFLCYVQYQNYIGFSLDNLNFNSFELKTPRLKYKNIIIKPASWRLYFHHYSFLLKKSFNPEAISKLFQDLKIPSLIAIKEGDNELPINTNDMMGLRILWDFFKKERKLELIEWLHFDDKPDTTSRYTNQVIFSLSQNRQVNYSLKDNWFYTQDYQKTFLPNSDVLSFKIYCGTYASDELIRILLDEIGSELVNSGTIKYFYFIRYADPHYHLRVRFFFKNYNIQDFNNVLTLVMQRNEKLKERKLLWKVEISTYERELKRYSPVSITLMEYIFYQDSKCYIKVDSGDNFFEDEKYRLAHGMLNVCYWLSLVKFSEDEKLNFLKNLIETYAKEFKDKIKLKQINDFYRDNKKVFNTFVNEIEKGPFNFRNERIIKEMKNHSQESTDLIPVLPDIIHMSQNRFFASNQRFNEFLVYCLVEKLILNRKFLKV